MNANEQDPWKALLSGYRLPYDPRPAVARLRTAGSAAAWTELWNELHHQGDVDTASYAAVPELVTVYEARAVRDWNAYALIGTIELERGCGSNPGLPAWLEPRYRESLARMTELAYADIRNSEDPLLVRSALSIVAIAKNLRYYGRILLDFDESEIEELIADRWRGR